VWVSNCSVELHCGVGRGVGSGYVKEISKGTERLEFT
jgi:hypothetical protein